jgi:hypothetical protein
MSWRRAGSFFHSISNPCNRVACEPVYGLFLGTADPATSCGDLVKTGSRWHGSCASTASGRGRPPLSCLHDRQQAFPWVAENLLDQNFVADRPDQVWLADVTYIPTSEGALLGSPDRPRTASGGAKARKKRSFPPWVATSPKMPRELR